MDEITTNYDAYSVTDKHQALTMSFSRRIFADSSFLANVSVWK